MGFELHVGLCIMQLLTEIRRQKKDTAASKSVQLHTFVNALTYSETVSCADQISHLRRKTMTWEV